MKTKKNLFIWAVLILIIIWVCSHQYNKIRILETKKQVLEQQVQKEKTKKSDIEILEQWAKENAVFAKSRLKEIKKYKVEIKKLEALYEEELLTQRCYEAQIERKINWLEYNLNYCKDKKNIQQFRTVK